MTTYTTYALLVGLYGAFGLGMAQITSLSLRRLWLAVILFFSIAIPTILQFTLAPELYPLLRRDAGEILHHMQLWRLVSALVVQDGGVSGAIFNLIALAMLALAAFQLLGTRAALAVFAAGALGGEVAGLYWQPLGAGNSVACCGLAAGILTYTICKSPFHMRIAAVAISLAALSLLYFADIHGAAFAVALVVMGGWYATRKIRQRIDC